MVHGRPQGEMISYNVDNVDKVVKGDKVEEYKSRVKTASFEIETPGWSLYIGSTVDGYSEGLGK